MSAIPELGALLDAPLAKATGWALLQFIWQGALVGVLAAIALALLQRGAADIRYVVAAIAMSLMLTLPIVSVIQELNGPAQPPPVQRAGVTSAEAKPTVPPVTSLDVVRSATGRSASVPGNTTAVPLIRPDRLASWLLIGWMLGVMLLAARLVSGWLWIQRLRIHAKPASATLCGTAERLARRLHISRAVRTVESCIVEVPTVIGWLKPVVLVPASALAGLSPAQLEAVLAHELAHVRRHDYLVNLLQTIVETLLFYHPAVWWVSRQIRIERENCCDDLAVQLCGDRLLYAQALADLEQLRASRARFALAATGGSLVHRVRRVLGAPSHVEAASGWLAFAVAITVLVSIAGTAASGTDREPPKTNTDQTSITHDAVLELARALRVTQRALHAVLHDLAPQVPPPPPLPPIPPEPRLPSRSPLPPQPPLPLGAAGLPPELPSLAEPAEAPPLPDVPDAPLPPAPPRPMAFPALAVPAAVPPAPAVPAPPVPPSGYSQKSGNYVHSNDGEKFEVNYRGDFEFTDDDSDVKSIAPDGWLRIKQTGRNGSQTVEFRSDGSGKIERRYWNGTSERPFEPEGRKWLSQVLPRFIRQSGLGAEGRVRRIFKAKGPQGVLGEISLIEGSWAKRIYFTELLKTPGIDAAVVTQALAQAGREVDSDFELASLLISSDRLLTDDTTRRAYIDAARSIDSDFEMRRVYSHAVKSGPLSAAALTALLESSAAIGSDFEQASLLIDIAKQQSLTDASRAAFFKAVATIESDFEQRRALASVVARNDLSPAILAAVLESASGMGSDHELATLLLGIVKDKSIEGAFREPFFRAADSIASDFERGRLLQAVAKRNDASDQTILEIIKATGKMRGDFESARVLLTVAGAHPLSREAREAYVGAADRLGQYEQGRVMTALVKNERIK